MNERDEALEIDRLAPPIAPGMHLLPVVHERLEITALVRTVLDALDPGTIAVELPTTLSQVVLRAVHRLPRISLIVSEEPGEEALVWAVAPGDPLVEALRWADARGRRILCIDPDLEYRDRHRDPVPDPYAMWRIGGGLYLEMLQQLYARSARSEWDRRREAGMAFFLQQAHEQSGGETILALVGAAHAAGVRAGVAERQAHPFARTHRSSVELRHLAPRSLTALLPDAPLAHAVWERVRGGELPNAANLDATLSRRVSIVRFGLRVIHGDKGESEARRRHRLVEYACARGTRRLTGSLAFPDRRRLGGVVWKVASGSYREQTGERAAPWQRRLYDDFAGRCSRVQAQLVPGLYEWVIAARGVGDDNLAWEVFDAARTYPWQEETAEIPSVSIEGSELDLGTRKVRFRRRFLRVKNRPRVLPVRERPQPASPEEWLRAFDSAGLCSFPPEDVVIEDYGRFLQRKAVSILSAERARTEPFTTSLLDGIDIRETLRKLHEHRVYVHEKGRVPGEAGSVIVIFDRDKDNVHFPFAMTWLGEHDQESDMAFYSTNPAEQVVGPGIMRATYGGFMLTLPRGRLFDVWQDRDYRFARDRAEILVMAGIDYSLEKVVVHVASEPPPENLRRYAAAQGKQLMHIPLTALSPLTLKKIRVLHILAGRDKRQIAKDFIW